MLSTCSQSLKYPVPISEFNLTPRASRGALEVSGNVNSLATARLRSGLAIGRVADCAAVTQRYRTVRYRGRCWLLAASLLADIGFAQAADEVSELSFIGINSIAVCYNFNCKARSHVSLSQPEWAQVAGWFNPAASNASEEREQIRHAVGWLEELVGRHTPTYRDVAGNLPENAQMPGQLDCIDESRNTTTYLKLLQTNRLLRFHTVVERAYRRALFDQHWSGQIEERSSGERYVVDSWFQDNGMLPYVQTTSSWKDIPLFTAYSDNSSEREIPPDGPAARPTNHVSNIDGDCAKPHANCVIRGNDSRTLRQ